MTRVLAGYWTHGGYLNWDTGFGFGRWHQMKKLALSQQALIAIAAGGRLSPSRAEASWAKHLLERGFELYERKLPEGDGRRARALLSASSPSRSRTSRRSSPRRAMAANAARAVAAGLPAPRRLRAAGAVLVRPRRRPPGGDHAGLQHRDHRRHQRRLSVRRDRPRAALRRPPGGRGDARRPRALELRHRRAQPARPDPARDRAPGQRARRGRRCGCCARRAASAARARPLRAVRRAVRRPARDGPARAAAASTRGRPTRSAATRSSASGRCGRPRSRRRSAEALFPSTGGERAAVWALLRDGQACR